VAENALLRQQLIILKRQVKRSACTKTDRILLVLLARAVRAWKQTLFIVQPETLLRWHREAYRLFWRRRSKAISHKPRVAAETIALIREMARENRLWGAERIHRELLKLAMHVDGHINRLKLIKRQAFGRASLSTLQHRFLPAA
jgi:putative transposase